MHNDPIQQMLGTLYSAPLQPAQWNSFLGQLSCISGVNKAALISHDIPRGEHRMLATLGNEVESVKAYETHYFQFDEWTRRFPKHGLDGRVVRGEEAWPEASLLRSTFYNEFLKPFDTCQMAAIAAAGSPGNFDALSVYRGHSEEPFSRELIATLQMVTPHLETALKLRRKLEGLEARVSELETALDAIASGIILLDRTGRCIFVNRAAQRILDQRDGLLLERSVLAAQGITESARLRELLSSSLSQQIPLMGGTHAMLISSLRESR